VPIAEGDIQNMKVGKKALVLLELSKSGIGRTKNQGKTV
jgi:hypothetical protein